MLLSATLLSATVVPAQIQIGLELEHRAFVVGEPFSARVQVRNVLDVPLVLDKDYHNTEFFMEVRRTRSGDIPESARRQVYRQRVIMPGDTATELVEITSLYDLRLAGNYQIRGMVRYGGSLYSSQPQMFDIVSGVEMLSARRHLPGYYDVELVYSLRYWSRGGTEQVFLRIEDQAEKLVYGTFFLGPVVRVNPPALRFDKEGRAVVVHQSGRNRFTRSVIEVDRGGATFVEQTHLLPDGQPYPVSSQR